MYKAALDVSYKDETAKAVCLLFRDWTDVRPSKMYFKNFSHTVPYEPGAFYKRELPCLLGVLQEANLLDLELVIIDGYVFLDRAYSLGLGGRLYESLNRALPVIGVAKSKFYNNTENVVELQRGNSRKPLYITAIGIDVEVAASCIKSMAGSYRIPGLLKLLDQKTKEAT